MSSDLAFSSMSVSDVCFWLQEKGFSDDIVDSFRGVVVARSVVSCSHVFLVAGVLFLYVLA